MSSEMYLKLRIPKMSIKTFVTFVVDVFRQYKKRKTTPKWNGLYN